VIIFYGTRRTGKVSGRDGQYAVTRFAHVYYLPLFPIAGLWITGEDRGHVAKVSWKSVLAGYARTWGPLVGLGVMFTGPAGVVAGIGCVAAAAATLAWRHVRTPGAQRRSDLNQLAFGTRCEPSLLPRELVDALRPELESRWGQIANGQSPSDVARFGADDVERAAVAYGVLRLSALSLPRAQASEAEADAARIADNVRELRQLGEGPYRSS
jgi:hypothetical protein